MSEVRDGLPIHISSERKLLHEGRSSGAIVQNFGPGAIRVGSAEITKTGGIRLVSGAKLILTDEHAQKRYYGVSEHTDEATVVVVVL